jgi:Sec-independent protein translocase protein TatA
VSLGPAEILVLAVVGLVCLGPRRRSEAARHLGLTRPDERRDLAELMVAGATLEGSA